MHPNAPPARPDDPPAEATSRRRHRRRHRPMLESCERRTLLTSYTVTSLADAGHGRGTSGDLRYCIERADADGRRDTITFAVTGTIQLRSVLPGIGNARGITLDGPGSGSLTVRGGGPTSDFPVLSVNNGRTVTISGLTLADGNVQQSGGGLVNQGTLTITDMTIVDNAAGVSGGGIHNGGTMSVNGSTIADNTAGQSGGGIVNYGTMKVSGSTVRGNTSGDVGGGIETDIAPLTSTDSTIDHNSAAYLGGGIAVNGLMNYGNHGGTLTVEASRIADNSVGRSPGKGFGGGIAGNFSRVTLVGTTVQGNTAGRDAGGVGIDTGSLSAEQSTFVGNSTGGSGGGVWITGGRTFNGLSGGSSAIMSVVDSSFVGNVAGVDGGGLESILGGSKVTGTNFEGNSAGLDGGGVSLQSTTYLLKLAPLSLSDSTLTGNTANRFGGGIRNNGQLTLNGATITGNSAGQSGGGLSNLHTPTVVHSTIANNRPDDVAGP